MLILSMPVALSGFKLQSAFLPYEDFMVLKSSARFIYVIHWQEKTEHFLFLLAI